MSAQTSQASAPCAARRSDAVRVGLLIGLLAFLMSLRPLRSPDVWHHVKSGWLVAQQGPASEEVFSCTARGARWVQYEWLAQLTLYGIHRIGGVSGLVLFRAGVIGLAAGLLYLCCLARGASPVASMCAVGLAFLAASGRAFTRPEIFTWVVFAGWMLAVEGLRNGRLRLFFVPALLMAAWVNLHGAWPAGLAWLGLVCAGETVRLVLGRASAPSRQGLLALWGALALALLATLANPYGWRVWEVPFKLAGTAEVRGAIAEWQRPDLAHWLDLRHVGAWVFLLALLLAPRHVGLPEALVAVFFGVLSLTAKRHLPLSLMAVAPAVAGQFELLRGFSIGPLARIASFGGAAWRWGLCGAFAVFLVLCALGVRLERAGIGIEENRYPIGAARFLAEHRLRGNLFNSYAFGNYLLFARYPENLVFIDGRVDVYGARVMRLYDRVRTASPGWEQALEERRIELCVLETTRATEERLLEALASSPEWALVYWDDVSAVYLRRSQRWREFLERVRPYSIRPERFDESVLLAPARAVQAERDYRRKLEEDPRCVGALYGLARCLGARGAREEAIALLRRAIALQPDRAPLHHSLGTFLLELGRLEEAEAAYRRAVRLDAGLAASWLSLGVVQHKRGRLDEAIRSCRRALKVAPDDWRISWNLAVMCEEKGDLAGALAAARRVLELQPQMREAAEKVRLLERKARPGA